VALLSGNLQLSTQVIISLLCVCVGTSFVLKPTSFPNSLDLSQKIIDKLQHKTHPFFCKTFSFNNSAEGVAIEEHYENGH